MCPGPAATGGPFVAAPLCKPFTLYRVMRKAQILLFWLTVIRWRSLSTVHAMYYCWQRQLTAKSYRG